MKLAPNSVSWRVVKTSTVSKPSGVVAGEGEADAHALRLADPVPLHQADLLRPAVEAVERGEQVVANRR